MTQLFDTTTYEDLDEVGEPFESSRHLRSIPAGEDVSARTTQWRLDQRTIDVGRKGIQAARQALQQAARENSTDDKTERKAA